MFQSSRSAGSATHVRLELRREVDETYLKVKGKWVYLYRAVDSAGQTVDFLLSEHRDIAAAKRFFAM